MKKAIFIIIVVILLITINNTARSIYELWTKRDLLTQAQNELQKEKIENIKLKEKLKYVESNQFIEEEARNKLFLGKPGDQTVLLPPNLFKLKEEKKSEDFRPNWQKWWDLFFNN